MRSHWTGWLTQISPNWLTVGLLFAIIASMIIWKTAPSKTTRLIVASQTGQVDVVEKLLTAGVNPNKVNGTNSALITAIRRRKPAVVKVLLVHGADPNLDPGTGATPLTWAVRTGDPNLVKTLVQSGADPERRNADGTIAADEAKDSPEILQLLSARPR